MDNILELPLKFMKECGLEAIYDEYRVVDPISNSVLSIKDENLIPTDTVCHAVWGRAERCKNCISLRCLDEDRTIMKLEYVGDQMFYITSLPIEVEGKRVALELVKNITSMIHICDDFHNKNVDVLNMIKELNEVTTRDLFTGIYNKQYITAQLLTETQRALQDGTPLTIAVMDIDDFKSINDTYGHAVGDEVLLTVASILKKLKAETPIWAGRFGGDEFVIAFPGMTLDAAKGQCDKFCKALSKHHFCCESKPFAVSMSIGIKQFDPTEDTSANYFSHADALMYEEKYKKRAFKISRS